MTVAEKIYSLRNEIDKVLNPIIGKRVIIPDAPYYKNIGDILIWQGTEDYLKRTGRKLLTMTSDETFSFPALDEDVTILLMGGGNFGDLWRRHQEARIKIISHYRHNRIVMLPQSVWYDDQSLIAKDSEAFALHPDLHLCARDCGSYGFMKSYFGNNTIHLVPDMAFQIDEKLLKRYRGKSAGDGHLLLLRGDKELPGELSLPDTPCVHDWPSLEQNSREMKVYLKLRAKLLLQKKILLPESAVKKLLDSAARYCIKRNLVRTGPEFMAHYSTVTTTRLHGLILAMLLYKPVDYIDNTTGKLSDFADTWLRDCPWINAYE